ncbi:MAG: glucose 1-dehydrogenase [Deinococcus-Thermus bacterium]|jgi:NAD(P)-dependent dehydrogenase (short-subunit alcohol dehydrogenase family)|nr:glucose 1-dehydrogenase [Deinococcota bacterium]
MDIKADGRLKDQVALITGGGSGIGRATARRFAEEGATVVIADVNEGAARATAAELEEAGAPVSFVHADVAEAADAEAMVAHAEERHARLTILFNNAGIMDARDDDAVVTDEDVWDLTLDVNAKGVFLGCKFGVPALRRAGGGAIVNTASFVALRGAAAAQIAYTASKGAVLALTRELAVVHAKENIRVNALCPGPLRTDLLMKVLNTEEKRHRRLVHVPMGRFGEAAEMAEAALYLADPASSYVTGTELTVDGGLTAAYVTPE